MFLADSNFWVALALPGHFFHDPVQSWFRQRGGRERVGFCRFTQSSFLRLITTAAVTTPSGIPPLHNDQAWTLYNEFLDHKRITFVDEPSGLEAPWQRLSNRPTPSPKIWMDTYLAAFAIAGNYLLVTSDTAFPQFADLKLIVLGN